MTCESVKSAAGAYLDEELDAGIAAQVREHLAGCGDCAEAHAQQLALRANIEKNAPYCHAPAGLRDRIHTAVRQAGRQSPKPWPWIAMAAGILLAVSIAWNVALLRPRAAGELVAEDVLSSHVRSLMGAHLLDVPSSDQHTVKPWFNGKLDFSPDVRDFAAQGFPLIGGRVDYVGGRAVAALVYQRRRHVINLFTWPSRGPDTPAELTRNGYHALYWNRAGMAWWAVSDLNTAELRRFENLYNP